MVFTFHAKYIYCIAGYKELQLTEINRLYLELPANICFKEGKMKLVMIG